MNTYEQRKQERIERYQDLAADRKREAEATYNQAHKMADVIPFGQPILIGHHSERRDRNYRGRIENKFRKSFELEKTAEYWAQRAAAAASNNAISSDDPEAIQKLKAEAAELELMQEKMKAANKAIRAGDDEALKAMGFDEAKIISLKNPQNFGGAGFPQYRITNNGANLRRIKKRIELLSARANDQTTEIRIGEVVITDNCELNRLQVFFPGKPDEMVRERLKRNGFHWSPTEGAWQRMRSSWAYAIATDIAKKLLPPEHAAALATVENQPATITSEVL